MMEEVLLEDQKTPQTYRPIGAIGHTKDLSDPESVDDFLAYLGKKGIPVATFEEIYHKLAPGQAVMPRTHLTAQYS
jgi:hypothetical protein